jgi:hypothetical protein
MTYTFIHPTKTGGTACELYFKRYYSEYITGEGHFNVCRNKNNPIILVRPVEERFISMYKYWKNGALDTRYQRTPEFLEKYKNYTIKDFIKLLKENSKDILCDDMLTESHFAPITYWFGRANYKNIIIIRYTKNLNEKINKLLNELNIPNKNIRLTNVNISKSFGENTNLDEEDLAFLKEYFKSDYELIDKINNNPTQFRLVI